MPSSPIGSWRQEWSGAGIRRSYPVRLSRSTLHCQCLKGKQAGNREGFSWDRWPWAEKMLELRETLPDKAKLSAGLCFNHARVSLWPGRFSDNRGRVMPDRQNHQALGCDFSGGSGGGPDGVHDCGGPRLMRQRSNRPFALWSSSARGPRKCPCEQPSSERDLRLSHLERSGGDAGGC